MGNADAHSRRGNKSDYYITPTPCVRALLDNIPMPNSFTYLDPCSGTGVIGRTLREYGIENITELEKSKGQNFLTHEKHYDVIIGNPPYSIKDDFWTKAMEIGKHIFFILPYNVGNYNSFHRNNMDIPQFIGKWLMTPKFFMGKEETENPKKGGVSAYAWYYWRPNGKTGKEGSFERYINLNDYFIGV